MEKTLLLNATYEPLRVISWKKAVILLTLEKVEVLEAYERMIHSISVSMRLPSVVRLLQHVKWHKIPVKFSRKNIYLRDQGRCQYCGCRLELKDITYDHVIPGLQGGKTSWENIVTCCLRCNRQKGGRTPQQAGMKLLSLPQRPKWHQAEWLMQELTRMPESWRDYLYWNVQLKA